MLMTSSSLVAVLRARASQAPHRRVYAFLDGHGRESQSLGFGELDLRARLVAAALQQHAGRGDRALLLYPPGLDFVAAFFGCLYAGVVAVPVYPPRLNRSQERLQAVAVDCGARVMLSPASIAGHTAGLISQVPELASACWLATDELPAELVDRWQEPEILPEDLAFLQYTSGSTSSPKGVMVTHGNLMHNEETIRQAFGQTEESVVVGWLPFYHDMGLVGNILQPVYSGGQAILMSPMTFLQRPASWLQAISLYRATTSGGPNFAYDLCARKITGEQKAGLDLSCWRLAFNGAEPIRAEAMRQFSREFAACGFREEAFYPCYGLAESTLFVTGGAPKSLPVSRSFSAEALERHRVVQAGDCTAARDLVGCGWAGPGHRVEIVDPESGVPCGPDSVGEVWVSGPSVAAGYWNLPEENARAFRCRLANREDLFLRTGDLGFLHDGDLFLTGRLKDLIILRGRNIYPQDVERTAQRSHPALRPGCGAAFGVERDGEERLVIVQEVEHRKFEEEELAGIADAVLRAVGEEHDVVSEEVVLVRSGTILKTTSGKIQRRACRAAYLAGNLEIAIRRGAAAEGGAAPSSNVEEGIEGFLVRCAAELLRTSPERLSLDVPLPSLGLDSLGAAELRNRVEERFGVAPSLAALLEGATLVDIAAEILAHAGTVEPREPRSADENLDRYPLSPNQQALWLTEHLSPESAVYNLAGAARIRGPLGVAALRRAFQALVDRHPVLRTRIAVREGEILQVTLARDEVDFEVAQVEEETWTEERLNTEAFRPFDLTAGPLMRVRLWTLADEEHRLLLVIHHLVADFHSIAILLRELSQLYRQETGGIAAAARLVAPRRRYAEYVRWQERELAGPHAEPLLEYWRERLAGSLPVLDLATDRPRPPVQTYMGKARSLRLGAELSAQLRTLALVQRSTLYVSLLAGFQALLQRYGQEELVIGAPTAGRGTAGFENVVGYFVNPVALRLDPMADLSFHELVARVRKVAIGAFDHQDLPFGLLPECLRLERDPSRPPVFQAMFVLHSTREPEESGLAGFALGSTGPASDLGGLLLEPLPLAESRVPFDLTLAAADLDEDIAASLQYNRGLFDDTTIERMLGHLRNLLAAALAAPESRVEELELLGPSERSQLLRGWNETTEPVAGPLLVQGDFEEQAARTPDAVALAAGGESLTYGDLDRQSNQLARRLRTLGVGPEVRVGIAVERSPRMVAAVLAVLKSGGTYVPLDPHHPRERLSAILEDARPAVLITQERLRSKLPDSRAALLFLDSGWSAVEQERGEPLDGGWEGEGLAYVIFTSGSTGRPKGVQIPHRAVVNFLRSMRRRPGLSAGDIVLAVTTLSFDIAVLELLLPLSVGARVELASQEEAGDAYRLMERLRISGANVLQATPATWTMLLEADWEGDPRLKALCGGEALPAGLAAELLARVGSVWNLYGPTETTVWSTAREVGAGEAPVLVGGPIANTRLFLLNPRLDPVPVGAPGDLYIGGMGLARGYLDLPGLTAERFLPDPFAGPDEQGSRIYQTGDRARWRQDGTIEFLGRADHQVKIRGFRVELGDVESTLIAHPGVQQAVALVREDGAGPQLVAYVVPKPGEQSGPVELRAAVAQRLPEYMVPGAIVVLDSLPLTPNGKVDRKSLPAPEARLERGSAPRTPVEEILAAIWTELLGLDRVGRDESFFELGGHSLLAIRMVSRVRRMLGVELALSRVFGDSTLAGLATQIERCMRPAESPELALAPMPSELRDRDLPLSFGQQRLWFLDKLEPGLPVYNMPGAVRLGGKLDVPALHAACEEIVRRHEALRTVFPEREGQGVQVIEPPRGLTLPVVDLSGLDAGGRQTESLRLAVHEARRPFELAHGPLMRSSLLRLADDEHVFLLTLHHIVSDGWSMGVFVREMTALYEAFVQARPSPLAELPVQFADFAVWQREWLQGKVLEEQLSYWRRRLAGLTPRLALPTDHPRPAVQSHRGGSHLFALGPELSRDLLALSRRSGATLFMTVLGAFQILLGRHAGQDDVPVGSPIAGRNRVETEGLIGLFVNTLVLRGDLAGRPSFGELLSRVRQVTLEAYAHQDVPFEKLVEELSPERDLSGSPLVQVVLAMQNTPAAPLELSGLSVELLEIPSGISKFDLKLDLIERDDGLSGRLDYALDLFDPSTAARMSGHLEILLSAAVASPDLDVKDFVLLGAAERHQVLREWNEHGWSPARTASVLEMFERQVALSPEAPALFQAGVRFTYRELDRWANRLANRLRRLGVGPEVRVAVLAERSPGLVSAMLGIFKAGGAYVPLDAEYPKERLAFMLADCGARMLLTQEKFAGRLPARVPAMLFLDSPSEGLETESDDRPGLEIQADQLAYVIYTSGSTGRPKGVMIRHGALASYTETALRIYGVRPGDRVLQFCSVSFDISLEEIVPCLSGGAELVLRTDAMLESVAVFLETSRRWSVTMMSLPTAYWHEITAKLDAEGLVLPACLRLVVIAGERALPERLASWRRQSGRPRLVNTYGLTESTIISTAGDLDSPSSAEARGEVSIGRVIPDTALYLLDRSGRPVPIGVAGELCVGGGLLARGYLNRPDVSAERFVPHPFSDVPGARLYRTGDLARAVPDGELIFLGRGDHQVKVRGYRIELEEIEARLLQHPEIESAVVCVLGGDKQIVGYVVPRRIPGPRPADLRAFVREALPDYMVPSAFPFLEALPLTPNGKVDRKNLPAPDLSADRERTAARTPVEEIVAGIWAEVLEKPQVGVDENFFQIGGHSLLAIQVASRVQRAFGIELPIRRIFEAPTVAELASWVQEAGRQDRAMPALRLVPLPRDQELELSFAQRRLWFIDQLEPGSSVYNMPLAVRFEGPLDLPVLAGTFSEVVRRHEALRTVFRTHGGEPVQEIAAPAPIRPLIVDLAALPPATARGEARRLRAAEERRPFDLALGPLFRPLVLRLLNEEHLVSAVLHHIVGDGWSLGVLAREVASIYSAMRDGRPSPLPELPVQYADFAHWQSQWLQGEILEEPLAYWREALAGIPPALDLSTDRPRPPRQSFRGDRLVHSLMPGLFAALQELGRREGATLFMMALSGLAALLSRYTGQEDVTIGTPVANRSHAEAEGLIGFFVNTLVLRADLSGEPDFRGLLARIRRMALNAYTHQDLPFEKLVEELAPERDLGRTPLFQVVLDVMNTPLPNLDLPGLRATSLAPETVAAHFDLTFSVEEADGIPAVSLVYCADLFDRASARALLDRYLLLLAEAVANPGQRVSDLPLLTDLEREQFLHEWSDTARPCPDLPIHRLFEEQSVAHPDRVALAWLDRTLTYGELNASANRLAHHLRARGVGLEDCVALALERSPDLIVSILAILKAGGVYVPLDPEQPAERLAFLLEDVQPSVVIAQSTLLPRLPAIARTFDLLCLDRDWPVISRHPATVPDGRVAGDNLAYLMYTSGSTGLPKGVSIPHRGVVRLVRECGYAELLPSETFLQLAPVTFDASTFEIWGALLNGARLVLYPGRTVSMEELGDVIEAYGVTTLWLTAGLFHQMIEDNVEGLKPLRQLLAGGDVLSPPHVRRALDQLAGCVVINGYGPTENTTFTCCRRMRAAWEVTDPVSLGRPITNTRIHVVDPSLRAVPVGVPGELLIGGGGLARGYWNRPGLTGERFIPDPLSNVAGERLYRTGDLVRLRWNGDLEFLGRMDNQVKIRGFRVEPGEIESRLAEHPAVRECAVVCRNEPPGEKRLVACVALREETRPPLGELRGFLSERLPGYMIPAAFVVLDTLPLTPNGKVDRQALPVPEPERSKLQSPFVPPRDPVEEMVAESWREVLGLDRIGVHDDFFELGGHSLLATRLISRLRHALGVEIPLSTLFTARTVAGLSEELRGGGRLEPSAAPPLVPIPRQGRLPLSFAQQRLWFLDQLEPGSAAYNVPAALELRGSPSVPALRAALSEIVRRHEVLRTAFPSRDGEPEQAIAAAVPLVLPLMDLSGLPQGPRTAESALLAAEEARRPFDLGRGPLLRSFLVRETLEDHILLLNQHHIVSDGWSMGVLVREMTVLYNAFLEGRPSPLPELPVQYVDFAHWQRRWLSGEVLEGQLSYWRRQLTGLPDGLGLPLDRPRPALPDLNGGLRTRALPEDLRLAVHRLGRERGSTLFMVTLAAFTTFLSRITGQTDVVTGSPIANRNRLEIEGLIGFFVNTLVLRVDTSGPASFDDLLERVREVALGASVHQDLPFERLVDELAPERNLGRSPLFQVLFTVHNAPAEALELPGLSLRLIPGDNRTSKFDLTLSLSESGGILQAEMEYKTALFDATTIERFLAHFEILLGNLVREPGGRIAEASLFTSLEWQQMREWNTTPPRPSSGALHRRFEARAARTPDAVALIQGERQMTYAELNARANQLAEALRRRGVGAGTFVGICLERSFELVVGLLGALKAGAGYVPLDPSHPSERWRHILADSGIRVLITQESLLDILPEPGYEVLCVDRDSRLLRLLDAGSKEDPLAAAALDDSFYRIYTSGSTGRPKGVAALQGAVLNLFDWYIETCGLCEEDSFLLIGSIGFDMTQKTVFAPLLSGGRLIIPPPGPYDPAALLASIERHGITRLNCTPSTFHPLIEQEEDFPRLASLRGLSLGGEPISLARLEAWRRSPWCRAGILNTYGPTECTDLSTWHRLEPSGERDVVPIGRPLTGVQMWVLSRELVPVPVGVTGHLCAAGNVTPGYMGQPAPTAEKFLPNPFSGVPGDRMYWTGDLARWLPTGEIEYLGRADFQIKLRGFRIEPGEIEAALAQHPAVQHCVVVAREDMPGDKRLVAYAILRSQEDETPAGLRDFLLDKLPGYMVPAAFVVLDALPLTPNGKVDRRALPAPEPKSSEPRNAFQSTGDPVEEVVAGIWRSLLAVEQVGAHDDFFALGGHSLLATQLVSRVRKVFEVELPLSRLFGKPTVAATAGAIRELRQERRGPSLPPLSREPRPDSLPLSFAQQRLWLIEQLEPGTPIHNMPFAVRLRGDLQISLLATALGEIVRRHEVLRTTFASVSGRPVQIVHTDPGAFFFQADLSSVPAQEREREAGHQLATEAGRPFDLTRGPLLRALLLRLDEDEIVLLLNMHHIVSDGWSIGVLLRELVALYGALRRGEPSPLPEPAVQYADFTLWQHRVLQGSSLEGLLAYWRGQLASAPVLRLPSDQGESRRPFLGRDLDLRLSPELAEALQRLGREQGSSLFMVLLTAFAVLLRRVSGQDDLTVGSPVANRNRAEIEGLIGFFVNTLLLRVGFVKDQTFGDLLAQVRRTMLEAYDHQDLPFDKLVESLRPERDPGFYPLSRVLFTLQNQRLPEVELPGVTLSPMALPEGDGSPTRFALAVRLWEADGGIAGAFGYNTALFERTTAERWLGQLLAILEGAVREPGRNLEGLWLLPEPERDQVRSESPLEIREDVESRRARLSSRRDQLSDAKRALLARRLRRDATATALPRVQQASWSPLVEIQPGEASRPFFCVHPIGGNVFCYRELSRCLGPGQPFYALQASGLEEGQEPCRSVETMAALYVESVRGAQPEGPYFLGGWSFGGVVAFEMARQLRDQGLEVALLALFDSWAPAPDWGGLKQPDEAELLLLFVQDLQGLCGRGVSLSHENLIDLLPQDRLAVLVDGIREARLLPGEVKLPQVERFVGTYRANLEALASYRPGVYPGRLTLFRPSSLESSDAVNGWESLAAEGVDLHLVPGDHYTMLSPPGVEDVAERLSPCLSPVRLAGPELEEQANL